MDGGNRAERDGVLAGILDVDHQLLPAVRRDVADGAEGLARLGREHLKTLLDRLLRHAGLREIMLPENR
jgi:hypothetical protein